MNDLENTTLSVDQLNNIITSHVSNLSVYKLAVSGEIQSINKSRGHVYIDLKGDSCTINCVIWASTIKPNKKLPIRGQKATFYGKISCYEKSNRISFQVSKWTCDSGTDYYTEQYEYCKGKGWFDKLPKVHPTYYHRIALLTSNTAAAYTDFLNELSKGVFQLDIDLYNVALQGKDCLESIRSTLEYINGLYDTIRYDAIIIIRGGGSEDDLKYFYHPVIVEEVHKQKTITMCGIGHERDHPCIEHAVDYCLTTPTQVAEHLNTLNSAWLEDKEDKVDYSINIVSNNIDKEYCRLFERLLEIQNTKNIIQQYLAKIVEISIPNSSTILSNINSNHKTIYNRLESVREHILNQLDYNINMSKLKVNGCNDQIKTIVYNYGELLKDKGKLLEKSDIVKLFKSGFMFLSDRDVTKGLFTLETHETRYYFKLISSESK